MADTSDRSFSRSVFACVLIVGPPHPAKPPRPPLGPPKSLRKKPENPGAGAGALALDVVPADGVVLGSVAVVLEVDGATVSLAAVVLVAPLEVLAPELVAPAAVVEPA
jgi:hypothetical protein